ncbi:RNA-dependent RNA polymerase [Psammotettix alienus reovirus]|nr:RNA-dependent RNA polymerase [Psammotettix alienus reovirus]
MSDAINTFQRLHEKINRQTHLRIKMSFSGDSIDYGPLYRAPTKKQPKTSKLDVKSTINSTKEQINVEEKRKKTAETELRLLQRNDEDFKQLPLRIEVFEKWHDLMLLFANERNLELEDLSIIEKHSKILMYNSDQFFPFLMTLPVQESFKVDESFIDAAIHKIINPPKFINIADYDIMLAIGRANQPKMRYMPNVNVSWLSQEFVKISVKIKNILVKYTNTPNVKLTESFVRQSYFERKLSEEDALQFFILNGLTKMHRKTTYQLRFGSYEQHLIMLLSSLQTVSEANYFSNISHELFEVVSSHKKKGADLVGIQFIKRLLSKYEGLPFFFSNGKIVYRDVKQDVSSQLPLLLLSLLNISLNEFLGAITHDDALVGCKYFCYCAETSLSNKHLEVKSDVRDWYSYFLRQINWLSSHVYDNNGRLSQINVSKYDGDIVFSDELRLNHDDFLNKIEPNNPIRSWAYMRLTTIRNWTSYLNSKFSDKTIPKHEFEDCVHNFTEWVRYVHLSLFTITNPGIYHKTSLALEYYKSLEIKVSTALKTPTAIKSWEVSRDFWATHSYDWSTVCPEFAEIYQYFIDNHAAKLLHAAEHKDFNEYFLTSLTHKSGGEKLDISDSKLSNLFGQVSNTRFASYALEAHKYDSLDGFLSLLDIRPKGTTRYQIDRRARIITIVCNAVQASEIFILHAFNVLKFDMPQIAVGKQVGNMMDAIKQLMSSGNPTLICNSSDISGMDASTLPMTTLLFRNALSNIYSNIHLNIKRLNCEYLCFNSSSVTMDTNRSVGSELSAYSKMIDVVTSAKMKDPILKDDCFTDSINVNANVFPSGLYGTSAQHSLFLPTASDCAMRRLKNTFEYNNVTSDLYVLGDDQFETLTGSVLDIEQWRNIKKEYLNAVNYKEEAVFSRFFGVFLQQAAIAGSYVPYPARVSMFADERSENVGRLPHELINQLLDHLKKLGQRCYGYENILPFGRAMWNGIRHVAINLRYPKESLSYLNRFSKANESYHLDLCVIDKDRLYISYPYLLISCSPISFPVPTVNTKRSHTNAQMVTATKGEFSYFVLTRPFIMYERVTLIKHNSNVDKFVFESKPKEFKYFIDWQERNSFGITVSEYLLGYNRTGERTQHIRSDPDKMDIIDRYAIRLRGKLNQLKLFKANAAKIKLLSEFGSKFPGMALGYEHVPREKLIESLLTVEETEDVMSELDLGLISYLSRFSVIPSDVSKFLSTFMLDIAIQEPKPIEISNCALLNWRLSLMPCMYRGSHMSHLLAYGGLPSEYISKDQTNRINRVMSNLESILDVEAIIKICFEIFSKHNDDRLISTFGVYMGLSDIIADELKDVFNDTLAYGYSATYLSIFDKTVFFFFTDSTIPYLNNTLFSTSFTESGRLEKYQRLLARDYLHSYANLYLIPSNAPVAVNLGFYRDDVSLQAVAGYIFAKPELFITTPMQLHLQSRVIY